MTHKIINHGYQRPTITADHKILGSLKIDREILQPNGQWVDVIPTNENQFNANFETFGCTTYGSLNCVEMIMRKKYPPEVNYSDRFTYISSDTFPPGNDPHIVAEAIRNCGVVLESKLPFYIDIQTLDEYRDMGPNGGELIEEGLEWKDLYSFHHEWTLTGNLLPAGVKQQILKSALKLSPSVVS